jgi:hypothetical protein
MRQVDNLASLREPLIPYVFPRPTKRESPSLVSYAKDLVKSFSTCEQRFEPRLEHSDVLTPRFFYMLLKFSLENPRPSVECVIMVGLA